MGLLVLDGVILHLEVVACWWMLLDVQVLVIAKITFQCLVHQLHPFLGDKDFVTVTFPLVTSLEYWNELFTGLLISVDSECATLLVVLGLVQETPLHPHYTHSEKSSPGFKFIFGSR